MFRNLLPIICCLVLPSMLHGQQVKLKINAVPEQTVVVVNNDTIGQASQKVLYVGFNERKGIDSHMVVFAADGYRQKEFLFTSESDRIHWLDIRLLRDVPALPQRPEYLVDWRNVVSGIPYGTELGAGTRWLYRFNTGVLDIKAKDELHEALSLMNLSLFDDLPDARFRLENGDSARYMLQGIVESYRLQRGMKSQDYASYYKAYTATVSVRWRVYDKALDSLLLDEPYASTYEYRGTATFGFHDAVVDNFYHYAQAMSSLIDLFNDIDKPEALTAFDRFEEADGDDNTIIDSLGMVQPKDSLATTPTENPIVDSLDVTVNSLTMPTLQRPVDTIETASILQLSQSSDIETANSSVNKVKLDIDKLPINKKTLASTIVHLIDSKGALIASGAVISKNGFVLLYKPEGLTQTIKLRFVNGVELDAELYQQKHEKGFALYKIKNANQLTAARISNAITNEDLWLATNQKQELVGVNWQRLQEEAGMNNFEDVLIGSPIFNAKNELIGFISEKTAAKGVTWLNAKELMNVFDLTYE